MESASCSHEWSLTRSCARQAGLMTLLRATRPDQGGKLRALALTSPTLPLAASCGTNFLGGSWPAPQPRALPLLQGFPCCRLCRTHSRSRAPPSKHPCRLSEKSGRRPRTLFAWRREVEREETGAD